MRLSVKSILRIALVLALSGASASEARDFTVGIKAWNVSGSANGLDFEDELYFPGIYFSWGVTDRLWISAGYVEGENDFTVTGLDPTILRSIEEVDSDLIVGWSFAKLDVGIGYRFAEFTTRFGSFAAGTDSSGPLVFFGGGNLFGQSRWGYYWGTAYMFADIDDDDGAQKHFNGEGGLRWESQKNFSVLVGYRYKDYSGAGTAGLSSWGPAVNLVYTFR